MVTRELSEVLFLLGCWKFFEVGDRRSVWRLVGADEDLRDVSCLVEGLVVQGLVALHHSGEVHQLQGQGRKEGRWEEHSMD